MENRAHPRSISTRPRIRRASHSTYPQSMGQGNPNSQTLTAAATTSHQKAVGIMARSFIRKESKSASSQSEIPRLESTA
jgi:hypothetical protein